MRDAPDVEARAQYNRAIRLSSRRKPKTHPKKERRSAVVSEPAVAEKTPDRAPPRSDCCHACRRRSDKMNSSQPPDSSAGQPAPAAPETLPEVAPKPPLDMTAGQPAVKPSAQLQEETTPPVAKDDRSGQTADSQSEPVSETSLQRGTKTDTSQISVFEVFGLPKPSETQEHRAVSQTHSTTPAGPLIIEPLRLFGDTQPTGATGRIQVIQTERRTGLRLALRYGR
jgi:hypothetical protein